MIEPRIWLVRVGRLAWARDSYAALGGWRRLWVRLWWRTEGAPLAALRVTRPSTRSLLRPPEVLHWRPIDHAFRAHYCGAEPRAPWSYVFDSVTCAECREQAEPMICKRLTILR